MILNSWPLNNFRCEVETTLIFNVFAVYVRKIAQPKYLKIDILAEHVRLCWGKMYPVIVKLVKKSKEPH